MKRLGSSGLIACLFISIIGGVCSTRAWADDWAYTLRPGDDIWSIARQFCGSGKRAAAIARHNNVADPKQIKPGQRINIPVQWLAFAPSAAEIVATTDNVSIQRASSGMLNNSRQRANVGDVLNMGDRLITTDGSAEVQFADRSTLAVAPHSHVLFNKLTEFGPAGMVDTHLRFAYGRGKATVQPQNRGNRFRIQTPEGIAAVRGTQFRVGHQAEATLPVTYTETLSGDVVFNSDNKQTNLPAGFGVIASNNGVVKESLLSAPSWTDNETQTTPEAQLYWQPLSGADHYVVTWSEQANSNVIFSRFVSHDTELNVDVPQGAYQLAVRGVSSNGLEGYDSARAITVQALAPQLIPVATTTSGTINFAWQYARDNETFVLTVRNADGTPVNRIETSEREAQVALRAGNYTWEVQAQQSATSAAQALSLQPAPPQYLQAATSKHEINLAWPVHPNADGYVLTIHNLRQDSQQSVTVDDNHYAFQAPGYGTYRIELTAVQSDIQSSPVVEQITISRRPWWLLILVPLLTL